MKKLPMILIPLFLCCCGKEEEPDNKDITTRWTEDGRTMIIEREGKKIGQITNASNGYFVELCGSDSFPDLQASYYEDDKTGLCPVPENVIRSFLHDDGSVSLMLYDEQGEVKSRETTK